jgi:hypothetical protein
LLKSGEFPVNKPRKPGLERVEKPGQSCVSSPV